MNNSKALLLGLLAIAVVIGGYLYYKEQNKSTVSVSFGGESFSATVE